MRRLFTTPILLVVFACSTENSLPEGAVYVSEDGLREIRVVSEEEVDIREGSARIPGRYTLEEERLRVVVQALGTESVLYFTLDPELGLIAEDGDVLGRTDPHSPMAAVVDHGRAQVETMRTLRNAGTALMAWLTDEAGAATAGGIAAIEDWPSISADRLETVLVPTYLRELPRVDGWGHPLEYRVAVDDPLAIHVFFIRSPGADGRFDTDVYETGPYDPDEIGRDIVWGDGAFLSWPERVSR